jgi:hypothetical protein
MAKRVYISYQGIKALSAGYRAAVKGQMQSPALESPSDVYDFLVKHAGELQLGKRNYELVVGNTVPRKAVPEFTDFEKRVRKLSVRVEGKEDKK